jgi:hypothetical protein
MPIKSFKPKKKGYNFGEIEMPPVHLGFIDGRDYYAFAEGSNIPSGGKDVSEKQLKKILKRSGLMLDIKAEARKHIEDIAPSYKQINALIDMILLSKKETLTKKEEKKLTAAQEMFDKITTFRNRSEEIEQAFLQGQLVDFTNDMEWGMEAEPAAGENPDEDPPEEEATAEDEGDAPDTPPAPEADTTA